MPVLLAVVGAGLWFGGILPPLLGMGQPGQADQEHGEPKPRQAVEAGHKLRIFADLPEIVANLNAGPRRTTFIKLQAKLELARAEDQPASPRRCRVCWTCSRPICARCGRRSCGAADGTYRLREELLARADVAVAPVRVLDVLFTEMLIQ